MCNSVALDSFCLSKELGLLVAFLPGSLRLPGVQHYAVIFCDRGEASDGRKYSASKTWNLSLFSNTLNHGWPKFLGRRVKIHFVPFRNVLFVFQIIVIP